MRNLFLYYLKKRIPSIFILAAGFAIATIILLFQGEFITYKRPEDNVIIAVPGSTNMFLYLSIMLAILCTVVPIVEFMFKMNRRSIDLYYSLPIKRIKLYTLKYLLGLIEIVLIFVPQWIISFIWTANEANLFTLYYYWFYLIIALVAGLGIYTYLTFFFTMANNLIDGIIFMVLGTCFLAVTMNIIYSIVLKWGVSNNIFYMRNYFIFSPLFNYSQYMYYRMCEDTVGAADYNNILALILVFALYIGAGFLFFFRHTEINNAEKVTEDSDYILGYRVMIPLFLATTFKLVGTKLSPLWLIIALLGYLAYSIFRRSFRIKKEDFLYYTISIVSGVLIAFFV